MDYKEKLRLAKEALDSGSYDKETIEYIFPGLKESEGEKVRKTLVDYFKTYKEQEECGIKTFYGIPTDSIIAWLEKQGEQKSAEWKQDNIKELTEFEAAMLHIGESFFGKNHGLNSNDTSVVKEQAMLLLEFVANKPAWSEEDEKTIDEAVEKLERYAEYVQGGYSKQYVLDLASRVESLKDRVQPQPKQEWSEEDEKMCQETIDWFERKCFPYALESENPARESIKWLKSLKERYTWKPSDEQMEALLYEVNAWDENSTNGQNLNSLYQDLKKLREE